MNTTTPTTRGGYVFLRRYRSTLISVVRTENEDMDGLCMTALDIVKRKLVHGIPTREESEAYHLNLLAQEEISILAHGSALMQHKREMEAPMPHKVGCFCVHCYW